MTKKQAGSRAGCPFVTFRRAKVAATVCAVLSITGCSRSPELDVLGSYFPAWIVCLAAALLLTFAAHALFTKTKVGHELWPLPLLYSSLVCFLSCTLWLIFFE